MTIMEPTVRATEPQRARAAAGAPELPPLVFEPPGPGSWALDGEHCERPHSRWISELMPAIYTEAFRAGMARYGALLDTIEMKILHGYAYICPRPVGAPPDAKGPPPRAIFWLLTRLHPALRKRIKRIEEVYRTRLWREDTREFFEDFMPKAIARFERIQTLELEALSDNELIAHLEELIVMLEEQMHDHFVRASATMMPVGDFIVHARDWTGCRPEEAVALLDGFSPYSVEAVKELDAVADAIRDDHEAARTLAGDDDGGAILDRLRARSGRVGEAVTRWLDRVGQRTVTGHDVAELRAIEIPGVLVRALRAHVAAPPREECRARIEAATSALRERVPEPHRAQFDEMLEDARFVYPMRDGHSVIDFWGFGLIRRGLLEAGRRLAERGRIEQVDHVVDLVHGEIASMLRGGDGPSREWVAAYVDRRQRGTIDDAPPLLGPVPGAPPPPEWLPGIAARAARAMNLYIEMMFTKEESPGAARQPVVTGTPASSGKYVGTARLVLTPAEFTKVQKGDVLVARITTPTYNVLLPMLGAVVTDRGGLLSHPAIVSREYGVPGVVGTRDATTRIPDGARVEVDGDAGTVRVLE